MLPHLPVVPRIDETVETFRVGLILTERCNATCSHCWFSSGPERTARMEPDEALDYIDQAREIPTVEWISFTGGEPFLLPEMLLKLVGHASRKGLRTECVTNCFWATTEGTAEGLLGRLVDEGLDVIDISADDFHQRHIPFDRVRNCYMAARRLGLKVVIMCAVARSSRLRIGEVVRLLGDDGIRVLGSEAPTGETPSALGVETGFIPVGRGADIPEDEWLIGNGPLEGPCKLVLRDIAIAPSGKVLPCCSAAGLAQAAEVGNARSGLRELIEETTRRTLFKVLSTKGPLGLKRLLGPGRRKGYVNRCHLCYDVLTDPRLSRVLSQP